jgi:hypothetical protein
MMPERAQELSLIDPRGFWIALAIVFFYANSTATLSFISPSRGKR